MDDTIIYTVKVSPDSTEMDDAILHVKKIEQVLNRFRESKLTTAGNKCTWGRKQIKFLGFYIGRDGLFADPKKLDKIKNLPEPTTQKMLRSALGLLQFYARFIPNYAHV